MKIVALLSNSRINGGINHKCVICLKNDEHLLMNFYACQRQLYKEWTCDPQTNRLFGKSFLVCDVCHSKSTFESEIILLDSIDRL